MQGSRLVDASGKPVRLIGVNEQGSEYACVSPVYNDNLRSGLSDQPLDDNAIAAMSSWKFNTVRVPLNEDCWLGLNPVERGGDPDYRIRVIRDEPQAGPRLAGHYRAGIADYIRRLHAKGMIAILELHWTAPGDTLAWTQWPLPDADHSPDFWRSVASTFRDDPMVIFELFNEPYFDPPEKLPWECLRDGCELPNACADCNEGVIPDGDVPPGCDACPTRAHRRGTYRAAGMQSLVDAIRSTGARQLILSPGRYYSNDLERWLEFRPSDPLGRLGATFHGYQSLPCHDQSCWTSVIAGVAAQSPVVATEFGPDTQDKREPCDTSYDRSWMTWADANGISWLSWAWYVDEDNPRPKCSLGMISSYDGTPRGRGAAIREYMAAHPG